MLIDTGLIGAMSAPTMFEVTREAVELFMDAMEDPAAQRGEALDYAPPTFPVTFHMSIPGLELDGSKMQLIHGEQQFYYTRSLRIGERITCQERVADVRERKGKSGPMTFVVLEMTGHDAQQQPVFTARSTLLVR